MSKWTHEPAGAKRWRKRAAVIEPAWAQPSGSFLRSAISLSRAGA
jgi:hypothetical protein